MSPLFWHVLFTNDHFSHQYASFGSGIPSSIIPWDITQIFSRVRDRLGLHLVWCSIIGMSAEVCNQSEPELLNARVESWTGWRETSDITVAVGPLPEPVHRPTTCSL